VSWDLEESGKFSVNSLYCRLSLGAEVTHLTDVWKSRVPPKIKIFYGNSYGVDCRPGISWSSGMAHRMGVVLSAGRRRTVTIYSSAAT
jgi:hypothetical protein